MSLVDKEKMEGDRILCSQHNSPIYMFCDDCVEGVCALCEHSDHRTGTYQEFYKKYKRVVKRKMLPTIRNMSVEFEDNSPIGLKREVDIKKTVVCQQFDKVTKVLVDKKLAVLDLMEKINNVKAEQTAEYSSLRDTHNSVKQMAESFINSDKSLSALLEYKKLHDSMTTLEEQYKQKVIEMKKQDPYGIKQLTDMVEIAMQKFQLIIDYLDLQKFVPDLSLVGIEENIEIEADKLNEEQKIDNVKPVIDDGREEGEILSEGEPDLSQKLESESSMGQDSDAKNRLLSEAESYIEDKVTGVDNGKDTRQGKFDLRSVLQEKHGNKRKVVLKENSDGKIEGSNELRMQNKNAELDESKGHEKSCKLPLKFRYKINKAGVVERSESTKEDTEKGRNGNSAIQINHCREYKTNTRQNGEYTDLNNNNSIPINNNYIPPFQDFHCNISQSLEQSMKDRIGSQPQTSGLSDLIEIIEAPKRKMSRNTSLISFNQAGAEMTKQELKGCGSTTRGINPLERNTNIDQGGPLKLKISLGKEAKQKRRVLVENESKEIEKENNDYLAEPGQHDGEDEKIFKKKRLEKSKSGVDEIKVHEEWLKETETMIKTEKLIIVDESNAGENITTTIKKEKSSMNNSLKDENIRPNKTDSSIAEIPKLDSENSPISSDEKSEDFTLQSPPSKYLRMPLKVSGKRSQHSSTYCSPGEQSGIQTNSNSRQKAGGLFLTGSTIVVKNLPRKMTKEQFDGMFIKFGLMLDSWVISDEKQTCGVVKYKRLADASRAIVVMHSEELMGSVLEVRFLGESMMVGTRLNVHNIPNFWTNVDVERAFKKFGSLIGCVKTSLGQHFKKEGSSWALVFAKFTDAEAALNAMHNFQPIGSQVPFNVWFAPENLYKNQRAPQNDCQSTSDTTRAALLKKIMSEQFNLNKPLPHPYLKVPANNDQNAASIMSVISEKKKSIMKRLQDLKPNQETNEEKISPSLPVTENQAHVTNDQNSKSTIQEKGKIILKKLKDLKPNPVLKDEKHNSSLSEPYDQNQIHSSNDLNAASTIDEKAKSILKKLKELRSNQETMDNTPGKDENAYLTSTVKTIGYLGKPKWSNRLSIHNNIMGRSKQKVKVEEFKVKRKDTEEILQIKHEENKHFPSNQSTIIVGNLPDGIGERRLRGIFDQYGTIKKILILYNIDGSLNGVIQYDDPLDAAVALVKCQGIYLGKYLEVFYENEEGIVGERVYVRNIPQQWTSTDLTYAFLKYGPLIEAFVLRRHGGAHLGAGVVIYKESSSVEEAVKNMNGHHTEEGGVQEPLSVVAASKCKLNRPVNHLLEKVPTDMEKKDVIPDINSLGAKNNKIKKLMTDLETMESKKIKTEDKGSEPDFNGNKKIKLENDIDVNETSCGSQSSITMDKEHKIKVENDTNFSQQPSTQIVLPNIRHSGCQDENGNIPPSSHHKGMEICDNPSMYDIDERQSSTNPAGEPFPQKQVNMETSNSENRHSDLTNQQRTGSRGARNVVQLKNVNINYNLGYNNHPYYICAPVHHTQMFHHTSYPTLAAVRQYSTLILTNICSLDQEAIFNSVQQLGTPVELVIPDVDHRLGRTVGCGCGFLTMTNPAEAQAVLQFSQISGLYNVFGNRIIATPSW